jgi:tetratricopeptide (TPR) repeat protein
LPTKSFVVGSGNAMTRQPDDPLAQTLQVALQHQQAGHLTEAEAGYRRVIALDPNNADALYGLATLALQMDQYAIAEAYIRRAMASKGEWPDACYHLGLVLQARDEFDQAIAAHRRAIALNPALFEAQYSLAVCLQISGERDRAIAAYWKAVELKKDDPFVLVNLSIALQGAGRLDESISALRRAVAIKPDFSDAFVHLGVALREKGAIDDAIDIFQRACDLTPRNPEANAHLAASLWDAGRIGEAIIAQGRVVSLRPDDANAHWKLGVLLLLEGDYRQGFLHFEWRWRRKTLPWPRRRFSQPLWDGGNLAGRTIYLHAEQSIGDTIHFLRFIPLVKQRGGRVVMECQQALRRLLQDYGDVNQWFSPGDSMPAFDVYCPLLSLPLVLGTTAQSIPSSIPYLHVLPERSQSWKNKTARDGSVTRVGLVWTGSPSELQDRQRSFSLSQYAPLADIPAVEFFSLQKGWAAAQVDDPGAGIKLTDFSRELTDFADTAALINELDLIITVDTAVAHLAGALGKSVWTLLPSVPNWRWQLKSEKTPWYSTMRLFRQSTRGDWGEVIRRVAAELRQFVSPLPPPALNRAVRSGNS